MKAYILNKTETEMSILTEEGDFLQIPICTESPDYTFGKTIFTPKKLVVCLAEYERTRFRKRLQYAAKKPRTPLEPVPASLEHTVDHPANL